MTRHEAVEEGEKTHTELVLAGRRGGGQREAASACGGPAACLLGLWDGANGPRGRRRAEGEGQHTDEPADVRSRLHAGEPEGKKGGPDGRKQCSQALACLYDDELSK